MARVKSQYKKKYQPPSRTDKDITVLTEFMEENGYPVDTEDKKLYKLMEKLTPYQITFCYEYTMNGFNASDARRSALQLHPGCKLSNDTKTEAVALTKKIPIARLIYYLTTTKVKKYVVTKENVLKELSLIAFSDITKFIKINEERELTLKNFDDMGILTRGIKKLKIRTGWKKAPDGTFNETTESEIELYDKLTALKTLAQNLGLLDNRENEVLSTQDIKEGFDKIANAVKHSDVVEL